MLDWIFNFFSRRTRHQVNELARRLGVSVEELKSVDLQYHEFAVRKRSGKPRQIAAPNQELKSIQRKILRRLLARLSTHPCATGFQPGISFVDNARCHQSQEVIVRLDIVDFFPSIREERIFDYFQRIGWSRKAAKLLTALTTRNGSLPQGAPTSPRLSNLVNYRFDVTLASMVARHDPDAIYTRYADDITISSSSPCFDPHEIIKRALNIIRLTGYRPHIEKKFDVRRSHQRQIVTGLVVNESANLPREKRRWLRAVQHRCQLKDSGGYLGPEPTLTDEQLKGWQSLQQMISDSDRVR